MKKFTQFLLMGQLYGIFLPISMLFAAFIFSGCQKEDDENKPTFLEHFDVEGKDTLKTETGLQYVIVQEGSGLNAENGLNMTISYTAYFQKDSTVFESNENLQIQLGIVFWLKGTLEGLNLMKQGAKYKFIIPPNLGYGSVDYYNIPANTTLVYDIYLKEVEPNEIITAEKKRLLAHIDTLDAKIDSTLTGLYYEIIEKGNGITPYSYDYVNIDYTVYLFETGQLIETTIEEVANNDSINIENANFEPIGFQLANSNIIYGVQKGIYLINEGGKIRLYIPSYLAYGDSESHEDIPPNSTLIFDIELATVIKNGYK